MEFAQATIENIKEDFANEKEEVVFLASIFMKMNTNDKIKWVEAMKARADKVRADENASLYHKIRAILAWQIYENLMKVEMDE